MINLVICDNEPLHCEYTKEKILSAFSDIFNTRSFTDGNELLEAVGSEEYVPDIAVLDIKMNGADGITIADKLNKLVPSCQIIFLTGYAEYASQVYMTRHVWFVLKEQADSYLIPAIERAVSNKQKPSKPKSVIIRSEGRIITVQEDDILYIDRFERKARVFCKDAVYSVSSSPAKIIPADPGSMFIRCHQGYWVNINHVKVLDHNEFILDNGTHIPISRSYSSQARARFFDLYRPD